MQSYLNHVIEHKGLTIHLLKQGSKKAPLDRKRRKFSIVGTLSQWKDAGNEVAIPSEPIVEHSQMMEQSVPNQAMEEMKLEDASAFDQHSQRQYVSKRTKTKQKERESLMM